MSSVSLTLLPYRLALRRPLRVAGVRVPVRDGAILVLEDSDGAVGYGDVTPLPGLHPETLEEAKAWLDQVELPKPGEVGSLREHALKGGDDTPVSAWFALESAYITLEASRKGTTPAALLADRPLANVAVNALFDGAPADARRALEGGSFEGYTSVKVKLGRHDPLEDLHMLETLVEGLPPETTLRLDANRGMPVEAIVAMLENLPAERIDYVEEPVRDPDALVQFHERTGLPVALDELLRHEDAAELIRLPFVRTLVFKPAMRGGVFETLSDAEKARKLGKRVTISSSFESGLGLSFLAQIAAAVMQEGSAAGLATDQWLAEDTLEPPFDSHSGWIDTSVWSPKLSAELTA